MKRNAAILFLVASWPAWTAPWSWSQSIEPIQGSTTPAIPVPAMQLDVVWPKENERYPFVTRSFTYGSVTPGSTLTINGTPAHPDADGAFFEMVDFSSGAFALEYAASLRDISLSTRHAVTVAPQYDLPQTGPEEVRVLEPAFDKELAAGDLFKVRCKGMTGLAGTFSITGLQGNFPLMESSGPWKGLYQGFYAVRPQDRGKGLSVTCSLRASFWRTFHGKSTGKISILEPGRSRVAVTTAKWTVVKTAPGGYSLFLPAGIRLESAGRDGNLSRVLLSDRDEGWIDAAGLSWLPDGAPLPRGVLGPYASTEVSSDAARISIDASDRLPFEVRHAIDPLSFEIRFFNAAQRFDRIRYASNDPIVREVRWHQESARVVAVAVDTRLQWGWGYDARYDDEGRFILDIRRPPDLTNAKNALKGRRIVIDPGHGPDAGALGPRRVPERDVNLAVAQRLEKLLAAEGAETYMIRTSTEGPSLQERPAASWKAGGELYVSIHNNAFHVTADPFAQPRGFMTFYYHAQSRPLAEAIHRSYQKNGLGFADESLQWGDLHVCRTTQMPSILAESGYLTLPDQEKKLLDPEFQEKLARTLKDGIRSFYSAYKDLQLKFPAERQASRVSQASQSAAGLIADE